MFARNLRLILFVGCIVECELLLADEEGILDQIQWDIAYTQSRRNAFETRVVNQQKTTIKWYETRDLELESQWTCTLSVSVQRLGYLLELNRSYVERSISCYHRSGLQAIQSVSCFPGQKSLTTLSLVDNVPAEDATFRMDQLTIYCSPPH